ncbi:MAG: amino acid-binding protein [Firmicutes bacterium HGW-Firmicutes-14]|nr:MAG: amino acid-binding protein [Firmicutes bacterium HGW-Firmicutes-14]
MKVQQISVFLENKSGRLADLTDVLGGAGINIRALSIADTSDFGILRLIVNRPDEAVQVLKDAGFTVSKTDVIAVEVEDKPGGLANVLKILESSGINIEYLYAFLEKSSNDALVVFRVEQLDEAVKLLTGNGVNVLKGAEVYKL